MLDLDIELDDVLYPEIDPFISEMMKVSDLHSIYVEQSGNPDGIPVIFLHGGPGGATAPYQRRFFNPEVYRIILFDQRGCGQSTPFAELRENTTWDLLSDMEQIRKRYRIDDWLVFGGSWGSTLALAYAQTYPSRCRGLILRGIFTLRQRELDWLYLDGLSRFFPDAWQEFIEPVKDVSPADYVKAYYDQLTSDNESVRIRAAKAWSTWEGRTANLVPDEEFIAKLSGDLFAQAFARIECHYFINKGWFSSDSQLLDQVGRIAHLPCTIVQGRYDMLCPVETAWELHRGWPGSRLDLVGVAGHSASEPMIAAALRAATDNFAENLSNS